jgi:hypothetical protein
MRRLTAFAFVFALGATAAFALSSCGEGDDAQLLPGETAREITANLDAVELLADEGDCAGAESAARQVGIQVETLEGVDRELKRALEQGAEKLNEVVTECEEETTEAVDPATVPETTESTRAAEDEKAEKEREKEEHEAEKEREKEEREAEKEAEREEKAKAEPPVEEEGQPETPSGGVSPGSALEEGEG